MTEEKNYPHDCPILDLDHAIHERVRSKGGRRGWEGTERRKLRSRFAPWVDVAKIALLIATVQFLFTLAVILKQMAKQVSTQTNQLERIGAGVENVHQHVAPKEK
jgi:hypothetical protein